MKTFILAALIVGASKAFAGPQSVEAKCYQSMNHSSSKPTVANSNAEWNVLLEDVIGKARQECREGAKFGDCLGEFLDKLQACENAGNKRLQVYIEKLRRSAEPHATHAGKPMQMSKEDRGSNK